MRKLAAVAIIVVVLIAVAVAIFVPKKKPASTTTATNNSAPTTANIGAARQKDDAKTAMAPAVRSALIASNTNDPSITEGNFTVAATNEPVVGWIVAKITPSDPHNDTATALLRRSGSGSLDLVAGPGTAFAKSDLDQAGVPADVQSQLVVFDDETQ